METPAKRLRLEPDRSEAKGRTQAVVGECASAALRLAAQSESHDSLVATRLVSGEKADFEARCKVRWLWRWIWKREQEEGKGMGAVPARRRR